jgi:O-methyltransferase domain
MAQRGYQLAHMIHVAVSVGLADHLGRRPAAELASAAGAPPIRPCCCACAGRWQTKVGSFFERVPFGGDVYLLWYLLSKVLHDWDDHQALRALHHVHLSTLG